METIGIIREWKLANFTVRVRAVPDFDTDLSFDDTGEVRAGLSSGRLMAFGVIAEVMDTRGAVIGEDSLWNCIYGSIEEFADHREAGRATRELRAKGEASVVGSYFSDMVHEAIEEARGNYNLPRTRLRKPKTYGTFGLGRDIRQQSEERRGG